MINPAAGRPDAEEREFGRIPDYVTPENRKRILELSRPNEKEISQVECSEYLIRHWLETVEDAVRCATGAEPGQLFKSKDEGSRVKV